MRVRPGRWILIGVVAMSMGVGLALPAQATPTAPQPPTDVSATGADSSLQVRWTAPTDDGGDVITGYAASAYSASSGGSAVSGCTTTAVTATNCVISGLTSGTTYYVSVTATNSTGTSAESTRTQAVAGTVPGVPTSVSVSRISTGLAVSWAAPTSTGGTAITSYTASAATSSSSTATPVATCTTTGLSCDITGLTTSVTYYISVRATNGAGAGAASSSVTATPAGSPTAPQNVTVIRGNGFGQVKWSAPTSTGGSSITRYVAEAFTVATGGDRIASCEPATLSTLQCNIGPLPNGGTYYVQVTAYNAVADGETSTPRVSIVPAAPPTVPRAVAAQRLGPNAAVSWQAPESDGGLAIESYVASAYASPTGGAPLGSCTTTGPSCQITGLKGAAVYVDVLAKTGAGSSPATSPRLRVRVVDAVDAPAAVAGSARKSGIAVSWQPPLDDGGTPITAYRATAFSSPTGGTAVSSCDLAASAPTMTAGRKDRIGCTIKSLKPDVIYYLEVGATSEAGTTVTAERTAVRVRSGLPLPPRGLTGFGATGRIAAVWTLPASDGGDPVSEYRVEAFTTQTGGEAASTCTVPGNAKSTIFTCELTKLTDFEPYWVQVSASNARGWGKATARVHLESAPSAPSAPYRVQLQARDHALAVSWDRPVFDGGHPITNYVATAYDAASGGTKLSECTVAVDPGSASSDTTPTHCVITGLTEDTYVYVDVTAENTVGVSAPSPRVGEAIVPGPPPPPGGVTTGRTKRGVTVTWSAVPVSSTPTVTSYRVRAFASDTSNDVLGTCLTSTTTCVLEGPGMDKAMYVDVAAKGALGWGDPSPRVIVPEP